MINILVPEAHTLSSIAVIRSLGRAGYNVHACSYDCTALGLKSTFANNKILHPPYNSDEYLGWLRTYIRHNDIKMIIPTSNILNAIKPVFEEFKSLLPVNNNPDILYRFFNKISIFEQYLNAPNELKLLINHPSSVIIDLNSNFDFELPDPSSYGYFIKFEKPIHSKINLPQELQYTKDRNEISNILEQGQQYWEKALVQASCTGRQYGVSVLIDDGHVLAVNCVRDVNIKPHSNGTMSLREYCWDKDLVEDAIKRLRYLEWRGCAMVEYRREEDGTFNIIEINARYWQYLHLDLKTGVDFPLFQAKWFLDGQKEFNYHMNDHTTMRHTWPGEVAWLVNEMKDPDNSFSRKAASFANFFYNFFIHSDDYWFYNDRMLYVYNFFNYLKKETIGRFR